MHLSRKGVSAMADTQRRRTLVNPARRKLSAKQIKAGFGGKRRQTAAKHHKPRTTPKAKSNPKPRRKPAAKPKSSGHRKRTTPRRTTPNVGKIVSYSLPKEFQTVATTKKNRSRKSKSNYRRPKSKA